MMGSVRAVILAAGKGTRMNSDVPKVLHEVGGQTIISHVLNAVSSVGSLKVYVVLGHQCELVKKALPKDIVSVRQKNLLGTADAVKQVAGYFRGFSGVVLVACGDTPLLRSSTIKSLLRTHTSSKAAATVLTAVVDDPKNYGRIVRDRAGQVMAIRERKDADAREAKIREINVGAYCFDSRKLFKELGRIKKNAKKKEFYLTDIIELFYRQNETVKSLIIEDHREGLGINDREDLSMVESIMREKKLKDLMKSGVTIVDPQTTFIHSDAVIGRDTVIQPFTVIEKNVKVGKACRLGPFCRLRPGTRLSDHVEIGNFTEVSRTEIGNKTLVKHFSFLGDARIGNGVNIGAGTVTANYDGKNKNITTISDGAFVGSDSVLVAPVKIGKKAVTGAGSVVTKNKNVPAGHIAVGVPAKVFPRRPGP